MVLNQCPTGSGARQYGRSQRQRAHRYRRERRHQRGQQAAVQHGGKRVRQVRVPRRPVDAWPVRWRLIPPAPRCSRRTWRIDQHSVTQAHARSTARPPVLRPTQRPSRCPPARRRSASASSILAALYAGLCGELGHRVRPELSGNRLAERDSEATDQLAATVCVGPPRCLPGSTRTRARYLCWTTTEAGVRGQHQHVPGDEYHSGWQRADQGGAEQHRPVHLRAQQHRRDDLDHRRTDGGGGETVTLGTSCLGLFCGAGSTLRRTRISTTPRPIRRSTMCGFCTPTAR